MSDAVYARSIIEELWPVQHHSRKSIITSAYEAIKRVEHALDPQVRRDRKRLWTERRIRSIVDDELPSLERYEVLDLEKMAVKEGRYAYRKSIDRAARIASFLAHVDEDFHGTEIDAQVALARSMAGAGNLMAVGGSSAVGASADRAGERLGGIRGSRTGGADE